MKWILSIVAVLACGIGGCGPTQRQTVFDENEYIRYRNTASSSVSGQAFLKTRGGEVKYGAGNHVFLNPVTTYSTEWWEKSVLHGQRLTPPDPRIMEFQKMAVADGEGRFTFENLAYGDYYITCAISWEVPAGYIMATTGGTVGAKVHLDAGQQGKVVLEPLRY